MKSETQRKRRVFKAKSIVSKEPLKRKRHCTLWKSCKVWHWGKDACGRSIGIKYNNTLNLLY